MKKLPLILATAIISLGSFSFAYADVIAQQTVSTDVAATVNQNTWVQNLGTSLTGTVGLWNFYARMVTGSDTLTFRLDECPDNTYTGCSTVINNTAMVGTITTSKSFAYIDLGSTGISLTSSKYYRVVMGSGGNFRPYGCTTNCYAGGALLVGGIADATVLDAYFVLQTSTSNTNTRIVSVVTPSNTTDADGVVPFEFTLYSGSPAATTTGFTITDLTTGQSLGETDVLITSSGLLTFTYTLAVTKNHAYSWVPLINLTSGSVIYGSTYFFNTGSSSPAGVNVGNVFSQYLNGNWNAIETLSNVSESNGSSTLEGFVNNVYSLQNVLVTKFPFNYFVEIASTLDDILSSSTTTTAYSFTVHMSGNYATSSGSSPFSILPTTWNVITSDTISTYYPDSTRVFFRSLLLTVIYVAWGLSMFNRVKYLFA
jgi:hypothetical protein